MAALAGGGVLAWDHPLNLGGVGATGTAAANAIAAQADVIIGIGTRYSDFTTASHTAFARPDVKFVNINVQSFDAAKNSATTPHPPPSSSMPRPSTSTPPRRQP